MDPNALNYNSSANIDDGTCVDCIYGCTDNTQFNYSPLATCDDGSCTPFIYGCTDIDASNYDVLANSDDGSCQFQSVILGEFHAGGIVIYVDASGKHGLVCDLTDMPGEFVNSYPLKYRLCNGLPVNFDQNPENATNTTIGGGYQNTNELAAWSGGGAVQASLDLTKNGRDDWFLPSYATMNYMSSVFNLNTINNALLLNGGTIIEDEYWTSNFAYCMFEDCSAYTFIVNSSGGYLDSENDPLSLNKVRAVREF